jgi:predicted ester cyclase
VPPNRCITSGERYLACGTSARPHRPHRPSRSAPAVHSARVSRTRRPPAPARNDGVRLALAVAGVRATVETMVAEGDWVATRYTWRATHTGMWEWTTFGVFMGVPPTGDAVREGGMTFDRIADGRIVEHRASWDWAGLARQIGALTLPEPTPLQRA